MVVQSLSRRIPVKFPSIRFKPELAPVRLESNTWVRLQLPLFHMALHESSRCWSHSEGKVKLQGMITQDPLSPSTVWGRKAAQSWHRLPDVKQYKHLWSYNKHQCHKSCKKNNILKCTKNTHSNIIKLKHPRRNNGIRSFTLKKTAYEEKLYSSCHAFLSLWWSYTVRINK